MHNGKYDIVSVLVYIAEIEEGLEVEHDENDAGTSQKQAQITGAYPVICMAAYATASQAVPSSRNGSSRRHNNCAKTSFLYDKISPCGF